MNLKQLKYFVTVAEELHFGRAAKRLFISQPPLSMSIQQLENQLGFALFVRNNKNVSLTDAGSLLYHEAVILLRHAEDMKHMGEGVALGTIGQLRIGFTSSMLFRGLDQLIHAYQHKYPQVNISLQEMNSYEQIQVLKQKRINIGFVHTLNQEQQIAHRLFLSENFICCLPKQHPLASVEKIDPYMLKQEKFVLFPRSVAPHYHDQITAICVNSGFSPYIAHEVRNWLTIVELVKLGLGIALVPDSMQKLHQSHICFIPLEQNNIRSETYAIWDKSHSSVLLNNFIDSLSFLK